MGCRRTVTGDLFRVVLDLVLLSRFFSLRQDEGRGRSILPAGRAALSLLLARPKSAKMANAGFSLPVETPEASRG
jgi:hypothetical protein